MVFIGYGKRQDAFFLTLELYFAQYILKFIDISIQKFMPDNACDVDIGGCILIMRYAN